jgi:hypothetical protein
MPKDFLVQLAQAYKAQPVIQIGYRVRSGGVGTVSAIVILQPILIAQASNSTAKRILLDLKSSRIHSIVGLNKSIIIISIQVK